MHYSYEEDRLCITVMKRTDFALQLWRGQAVHYSYEEDRLCITKTWLLRARIIWASVGRFVRVGLTRRQTLVVKIHKKQEWKDGCLQWFKFDRRAEARELSLPFDSRKSWETSVTDYTNLRKKRLQLWFVIEEKLKINGAKNSKNNCSSWN